MSKNRKTQVTIAIILGLVLIAITGIAFYAASKAEKAKMPEATPEETPTITKNYIETCLKQTLEDGILALGPTAGLYQTERYPYYLIEYEEEYSEVYPYFYEKGIAKMPELSTFEHELGLYIEDNLELCIEDFESLREIGIDITAGIPTATIIITPTGVSAKLEQEIIARTINTEITLREFNAFKEARLLQLLQSVTVLVKEIEENPYFVPIAKMLDESEKNNLIMDALVYEEDEVIIITVQDNQTIINGEPYIFIFAAMFNMSNIPPKTEEMPAIIVKPGEELKIRVPARDPENKVLIFLTNDSRFPIDLYTGDIETTVPNDIKGETRITIYISDGESTIKKEITLIAEQKKA